MKRSKRHKVKQETSDTSTSRASSQKEHDLAYYIHDRVELMHQVFTVLKPKELKEMAPDCVRHVNISDLQELCMEELLGISSKRLCAILDGAEPPSDTESSSESSPDMLETISLDSISSDDEILSQVSSKKSKKHKHHSKSKSKKKKSKDNVDKDREQEDKSRRAGLTMLELLELQARARAIRAQLQKEQALAVSAGEPIETVTGNTSDDEVEIKEETAEVVEISSEDEKPNVQELEDRIAAPQKENEKRTGDVSECRKTVTKKVNDLVITVPQTPTSRKIKLKRNINHTTKSTDEGVEKDINATVTSHAPVVVESNKRGNKKNSTETVTSNLEAKKPAAVSKNTKNCTTRIVETTVKDCSKNTKNKCKNKDKKNKKKKDKKKVEEGSDHDEITLQLSDTEKLDLLEGLERKTFEMSSDTEDSCEDSDSADEKVRKSSKKDLVKNKENSAAKISCTENTETKEETNKVFEKVKPMEDNLISDLEKTDSNSKSFKSDTATNNVTLEKQFSDNVETDTEKNSGVLVIDKNNTESTKTNNTIEITDMPLELFDVDKQRDIDLNTKIAKHVEEYKKTEGQETKRDGVAAEGENDKEKREKTKIVDGKMKDILQSNSQIDTEISIQSNYSSTSNADVNIIDEDVNIEKNSDKNVEDGGEICKSNLINEKSEGELSDRDSSEVEESQLPTEVVCISDDEDKRQTKKKKEKKSRKGKKSKKSKDFRKNADQNFYIETSNKAKDTETSELILAPEVRKELRHEKIDDSQKNIVITTDINNIDKLKQTETSIADKSDIVSNTNFDDDLEEILELSDDSSCYEVEEITISEEPTTEEIKALSAKIDEIERVRSIDMDEVGRNIVADKEEELTADDLASVSWKDRYLKSTKVKEVLSTANILNAMRKKNLYLKKKLQESKTESKTNKKEDTEDQLDPNQLIEGSIQHYNTLEASTKYVDPVKEPEVTENVAAGVNTDTNEKQNDVSTPTNEVNITDKKDKVVKDTVTTEMKKEAKQLLKMYKMLLKYNDVTKQPDTTKKKKKKKKSKDKSVAS